MVCPFSRENVFTFKCLFVVVVVVVGGGGVVLVWFACVFSFVFTNCLLQDGSL